LYGATECSGDTDSFNVDKRQRDIAREDELTEMNDNAPSPHHSAPRAFSVTGRVRSFTHAFRGLGMMLRSQHNAWVHLAATIAVIVTGFVFQISRGEWCWIVLAIVGVWTAEALNTAFEFLCDVASPQFHPMVKHAKDVAAGAVLICALGAVMIGLLVFVPHLGAAVAVP
jgi:diacylglycerol kinase (ATP)